MKIEELTEEMLEEAKKCKTPEARMNFIKDNNIELSLDQLDAVAGGAPGDSGGYLVWCPKCGSSSVTPTGNTRPGEYGIIDDAEYICDKCKNKFWWWI